MIASTDGGMDIEEVAAQTPEKIQHGVRRPGGRAAALPGAQDRAARSGSTARRASGSTPSSPASTGCSSRRTPRWSRSTRSSSRRPGELFALDGKLNFDDNALFRHPDIAALRDPDEEDPRERAAKEIDLAYVGLDGDIGCMVNGAGLAMATMDMITVCGGRPANFLDVGGGADKEKVKEAFKLILRDDKVRAILVNIFGGIVRCDLIAEGVVAAAAELGVKVPLVVRLQGTNAEQGSKILAESGLAITPVETLREAGERVVAAARGK